jgi:hypothetical protein
MKGMFSMTAGLFGVAMLMACAATPAAAGGLSDGEYDCGGGYTYRAMGKVDIKGDQYRFRPLDASGGAFAPYTVDANGAIHWGGHFPGLDDPPARITESKREAWGFNVMYQGSPDALVNTMSCHAPGK